MVNDVLAAFGNQQQQEKYLSAAADGALGAFAMTEPTAGSDAASIRTSATTNDDGYELNGEKCFISNIGTQVGHHAIVFAVTDPQKGKAGISAFIVEHGTPGLVIGPPENKMGIRAAIVSGVAFNHCQIPAENRLGNEGDGFSIAMYALERGRISMVAQAVGISEAAIAQSAAHLSLRQQFGAALERQQGSQWYLAEMSTRTEAALALIYQACDAAERGLPLLKYSSMCKYFAAETAVYVTNKALQLHGGCGYMKDYPIERLYRDARIIPIYEGTSEIQKKFDCPGSAPGTAHVRPCIISVTKPLFAPRYPTIRSRMAANRAEISLLHPAASPTENRQENIFTYTALPVKEACSFLSGTPVETCNKLLQEWAQQSIL